MPVCSEIMTDANCIPVEASRRANYIGDFRVPALLGAKPISPKKFFSPVQNFFPGGCSKL
jgi:hypothetical protein